MASTESESKRRRISLEESRPQPSVVVSSSPTGVHPADDPAAVSVVAPKLDEIPQLLFVELHKDRPESVVEALKRISDLFLVQDDNNKHDPAIKNWEKTHYLGPISFVVVTMNKWSTNHDVQLWSCGALCNLLSVKKSSTAMLSMAKSGGVEAVIGAMKTFPQSDDLQMDACMALGNTFFNVTKRHKIVQDCAARFVEELEGVALMLGVMKQFPDDEELLNNCCWLFDSLATCFPQHHGMFIDAGVVEVVASVQKRYSGNETLKQATKEFMSTMFS
ncbi:expressed unknown protein [Seminavis robusta]|uniref:LRRK2 ARM repeat domain-containing protein n=1 Tax=Seminavis robusta TaxID=568900 RepID=A0A9N8HER8_9STRA|nr:expressed unknown protein [Seminavis robusta]|eukprot:Sro487_g152800.1 n/a (276) ;mRNA; r:16094-16921